MPSHKNGGHNNSLQKNAYLAATLVSLDMLGRNACDRWESKAAGPGHFGGCLKRLKLGRGEQTYREFERTRIVLLEIEFLPSVWSDPSIYLRVLGYALLLKEIILGR